MSGERGKTHRFFCKACEAAGVNAIEAHQDAYRGPYKPDEKADAERNDEVVIKDDNVKSNEDC